MARQANAGGFPFGPVYVNETATRQAHAGPVYIDETSGGSSAIALTATLFTATRGVGAATASATLAASGLMAARATAPIAPTAALSAHAQASTSARGAPAVAAVLTAISSAIGARAMGNLTTGVLTYLTGRILSRSTGKSAISGKVGLTAKTTVAAHSRGAPSVSVALRGVARFIATLLGLTTPAASTFTPSPLRTLTVSALGRIYTVPAQARLLAAPNPSRTAYV